MLEKLMRNARLWWLVNQNSQAKQEDSEGPYLCRDLARNLNYLKNTIGECPDLIIRQLQTGQGDRITMTIVYLDGLVDVKYLDQAVLHPLLIEQEPKPARPAKLLYELQRSLLKAGTVTRDNSLKYPRYCSIDSGAISSSSLPSGASGLLSRYCCTLRCGYPMSRPASRRLSRAC